MRALFRRSVVTAATTALVLGALAAAAPTSGAEAETHTVTFTGPDIRQFVVPDGVTVLHVEALGASGGNGGTCEQDDCGPGGAGGLGAHVSADVAVTPGEVLTVIVGGRGTPGPVLPDVGCDGTLVDGGAGGTGAGDGGAGGCPAAPGGGGGGWALIMRGDDLVTGPVLVAAAGGGGGGGGGNEDAQIGHPAGGAGGDSGSPGEDGEGDSCHGFGGGQQALSDGGEGGGSFDASDGENGGNGALIVGGGFGGDGGVDNDITGAGGGGGGAGFVPGGGGGGGGANDEGCGGPGGGGAGGESHLDESADGSIVEGAHPGDATLTISYTVEIVELAPRLAG